MKVGRTFARSRPTIFSIFLPSLYEYLDCLLYLGFKEKHAHCTILLFLCHFVLFGSSLYKRGEGERCRCRFTVCVPYVYVARRWSCSNLFDAEEGYCVCIFCSCINSLQSFQVNFSQTFLWPWMKGARGAPTAIVQNEDNTQP